MKKIVSLACAFAVSLSCAAIPTVYADNQDSSTLSEEKISLADKNMYMFTVKDGAFKYSAEVSGDDKYTMIGDADYSTDMSAFAGQNILVIDLGEEYPISTIKAYQNTSSNSNFICFYSGFKGIDDSFVRSDLSTMIRTNISSTTENGARCFTKTELASKTHNMGKFRYVFVYNWSAAMSLSELELYRDTTPKSDMLSVNNFYGSNMVLQRNKPHVIKGFSATGESVSVTMTEDSDESNTQTVTVMPDENGRWTAELEAMAAGMNPYTITVSDGTSAEAVVMESVLVGDVFLASGQSNMAYDAPKAADQRTTQDDNIGGPLDHGYYKKGMYELQKELAQKGNQIRLFKMRDDGDAESGVITDDVPIWINWHNSNDIITETNSAGKATDIEHESVLALSSLAAFFADKVSTDASIPVGIIQASRGGSAIDIWSEKGTLYNNHIAPLAGLNLAGILWYQGCANSNEKGFKTYKQDFKKLIKKYREIFNDNALPFMYVQLAPFKNSNPEYVQAGSQRFQIMREIQSEMLDDSEINTNLYMAVSMDTTQDSHHDADGNVINKSLIHPLGKDILGRRMANAYLGMMENDGRVISGPLADTAAADGNTITVSFKENTAEGLKVLNPDYSYQCKGTGRSKTTELQEFKIAGADGVYYDATAVIDGATVKVSSDKVAAPKYVSYAYSELPANPNLANGADLPASPFNIGVDGVPAPTAAPETAPTAEPSEKPSEEPAPTNTPEPSAEPDSPEFTVAADESIKRGVEKAIADIEIPQDKAMQFVDGDNVAIIGDSITNMDFYSSFLTELYAAKKPDAKVKFYNMGIGGNTALLGLQMLDKEFKLVNDYDGVVPNKAIIMYGMNDSSLVSKKNENGTVIKDENGKTVYQTDEENIEAYKENMTNLIAAVKAKGVQDITIMSSSPYDDTMQSEIIAVAPNKEGARGRLMAYAEWLKDFTAENNCHFINLTETMYKLLDKYQEEDNTRTFINPKDRVHPRELGGFVMMYIIAKSQGLDGINSQTEIAVSKDGAKAVSGAAKNVNGTSSGIEFTYTPSGHSIAPTSGYFEANRIVPLTKDFNQEIIKVTGLSKGYYDIDMDGFKAGPYTAEELAQGINTAVITNSPITRRAAQLYGDMFAGHKVIVDYMRNIRCAEKKAMQAGNDIMDDAAVRAYIEKTTDETVLIPQYRNKYLEYKDSEKELFTKYGELIDNLYADAAKVSPITISVSKHEPKNTTYVMDESFNNGIGKWKQMIIGSSNPEDYGKMECDYVTGSDLTDGSGAGSAKIGIGINKARNYYTLADRIPVIGGIKLDVSAAVKTQEVRTTDLVNMSVIFYGKDNKTTVSQTDIQDEVKGSHDWQTIGASITVPENACYMRVDISGRGMTADAAEKQGTAWFDDVRVSSELQNTDFEDASNGIISAWTTADIANPIPENYNADLMSFKSNWTLGANSAAVTSEYDQENYVSGGRSLKFVSTVSGDSADRCYFHVGGQYIKLKPNTSYKITIKAKTENYKLLSDFSQAKPAGVTYQAILYKEKDGAADTSQQYKLSASYLNVPGSTDTETSSDWTDYSMILKTPAAEDGQTYQYLRSNVMMRFASGMAWVDGITVEECDENGNVYSSINADTDNKVSGAQSLIVKGNAAGVTYSSEPVMITGGQKYLFSAYAMKDDTAVGKLGIETYNSKGERLSDSEINISGADFSKSEETIVTPETAVYAVFKLYAENGNMNVDNIGISKLTGERDTAYEFTSDIEIKPVYLEVLGNFKDKLSVEKLDEQSSTTLIIKSNSGAELPALTLYEAVYTAENALKSVSTNQYTAGADGTIRIPLLTEQLETGEYSKIMLWDDKQEPVIGSIEQRN